MRKILILLLSLSALVGCDDIETNEVAMQANIDNRFYASTDARASVDGNGAVTIQGFTQEETLTVKLSRLAEGNFGIGEGLPNFAIFEDYSGNTFSTNPNGEGFVNISEVNEANKTLSGTFKFNAMLPGIDTIYVSRGVMFNIPYGGENIGDPSQAGSFSAKVNGQPYLPIVVSARNTGNSLAITGSTSQETITLVVPAMVEVGDYQLPTNGYSAKYQDINGPQTTMEGRINIVSHNPETRTLKGSFNFSTNLSEITEGFFEVTYSE